MIRLPELEATNVGSEPSTSFHQAENWENEYLGTSVNPLHLVDQLESFTTSDGILSQNNLNRLEHRPQSNI